MSLMMVSPKENRVDAILGKNDASQGHLVQNGKCTMQPLLTPSFETFETQHRSFEKFVIQRWIFLKENSNAPTWKQKFLESKFLIEKDIEDSGNSCMKRAELAEWLLIKALQKIKSVENIQLISDVVFKDGFEKTTTGNVFHTESISNIEALHLKLSKHQCDIEKNLTREDAIAIKDQLMQDEIIELTENEKLIKDEKRFPEGKTSLKSAVFIMIQNKLKLGSYQCFINTLETINNKKRRRPITQLIRNLESESMADSTHSGRHTIQIDTLHSKFHDKNIEGKEDFILTMEATNEEGNEVLEAYIPTLTNPKIAETILVTNLPVKSIQISTGSLVFHFRLMERNMQDYLKDCLRSGKISTVVKMLFSETSIKDIIPVGKLQLKVKIEVNKDTCLPESLPEHSSTINNFVMDNRSFIKEEMDTDLLEEELKKIGKSISYKPCSGRKEKADQILDFIIANKLEERFVSVIKTNKENRFDYVLKRIETYEQVYGIDASCLRKNVLTQFSEIVKVIDIDDVREVLLERKNTIGEHSLNDIDNRFSTNREIGMATLLLKILKSGDAAVRAFVDALFIMRSSFAENMLRCKSELVVIEEDSKVAICGSSMDDNVLFDGSFNLIIEKMGSDIPNTIQRSKVLPTHNTVMFTNQTDTLTLTDDIKIKSIRRLEEDGEQVTGISINRFSPKNYRYIQKIVKNHTRMRSLSSRFSFTDEQETNVNNSDGQKIEKMDQTFNVDPGFLQRSPSAITIRNMTKHKRYNTYPNLKKDDNEKRMREYRTQASAPVRADPDLINGHYICILEKDGLSLPLCNKNDETDAHLKPLALKQHVVDVPEEDFFDAVESLDGVGHNEENDENKSFSEAHVINESLCMDCVKPLQVFSKEDIKAGDHIAFPGRIYDHHAIVIGVDTNTGTDNEIEIEIVHATNTAAKATFPSFYPFGNKARLKKVKQRVNFKDKKVVVYKYSNKIELYPPHVIAERAKSEANADLKGGKGKFKYNLLKNNCEHFATWCVTGRKRSLQERKFSMVFWMFLRSGFQGISDENERNEKEYENGMLCFSCYERNKTVLDVKKRHIFKKTDVKIGDIITYSYYNLWHNAVVLDVNGMEDNYTTCDIAHYAYCGPFKHHTIVKEKLFIPFDGSIKVIIYPSNFNTYTAQEVVDRAEERLNEQEFAYFSNDSNKFARWCKLKLYK